MTRHIRKSNGEFNGSIGDGETKTPKPGFSLKRKVASPRENEIANIEEAYYLATEIPQRQYRETLAPAILSSEKALILVAKNIQRNIGGNREKSRLY